MNTLVQYETIDELLLALSINLVMLSVVERGFEAQNFHFITLLVEYPSHLTLTLKM